MKKIIAMILILLLCGTAFAAEKPQAVSRGGTIVVRVPYGWIDSAPLAGSWWGFLGQGENDTPEDVLFPIVPPSKVAEILLSGDFADRRANVFNISSVDSKALVMNNRPLDDHWYTVLRPEKKFGKSFDMHWSVAQWQLSVKGGEVSGSLELDMPTEVFTLSVDSMDDAKAAWEKNCGSFTLSLFPVEGVHIAVIREKGVKREDLEHTQLYIDGKGLYDYDYSFLRLRGYMDGKNGVYCCVLSDEEAVLIKDGAALRLEHDHGKW